MAEPSRVPLTAIVNSLSEAENVLNKRKKLPKTAQTANHFLQHLGQTGFQTATDVEKFLNSPAGKIVQAIYLRELAEEEIEEEEAMQLYQHHLHERQVAFTLIAHLLDEKAHQELINQAIEDYNHKIIKEPDPHTIINDSITIVDASIEALENSIKHLDHESSQLDDDIQLINDATEYSDNEFTNCINVIQETVEEFFEASAELIDEAIAEIKLELEIKPKPQDDETYAKVHKVLDNHTLKEQFDPVKIKLQALERLRDYKPVMAPTPSLAPTPTPSLTPKPKFHPQHIKELKSQGIQPKALGFSQHSPVFNLVEGLVKKHHETSKHLDKTRESKKNSKKELEEAKKLSKERITCLKVHHEKLLDQFNRLGAQYGKAKTAMGPAPKHDDTAPKEHQIRKP